MIIVKNDNIFQHSIVAFSFAEFVKSSLHFVVICYTDNVKEIMIMKPIQFTKEMDTAWIEDNLDTVVNDWAEHSNQLVIIRYKVQDYSDYRMVVGALPINFTKDNWEDADNYDWVKSCVTWNLNQYEDLDQIVNVIFLGNSDKVFHDLLKFLFYHNKIDEWDITRLTGIYGQTKQNLYGFKEVD